MHDLAERNPTEPRPAGSEPKTLRIHRVRLQSEVLVLVSVPSLSSRVPSELTSAERSVLTLLLDGLTSLQIARQRGTSVRTVANQAAAIFRKLGVHRRAQLAHALAC